MTARRTMSSVAGEALSVLSNAVSSGTGGAVSITGGCRRRRRVGGARWTLSGGAGGSASGGAGGAARCPVVPRTRAVR